MAASYRIFETDHFLKEFEKTASVREQKLILSKLSKQVYPQLAQEPHFGMHIKKLRDFEPESWRYRIGSFRLFYSIDEKEKVIVITAIRLRRDAYR